MKATMDLIDTAKIRDRNVKEQDAIKSLMKVIQGQGEKDLSNYEVLTKGLNTQDRERIELSMLNRLMQDSTQGDLKVFDSHNFFNKLNEFKGGVFNTPKAKEYIDIANGFHKLFKNDSQIANNLKAATTKNINQGLATTLSGAAKFLWTKFALGTLYRNAPDRFLGLKLPKALNESTAGAALKYHIKRALERSSSVDEFSKNLELSAKNSKFSNDTLKIIDELQGGLNQAKQDFKQASEPATKEPLKAPTNDSPINTKEPLRQATQEQAKEITEQATKEAHLNTQEPAREVTEPAIKDAHLNQATNDAHLPQATQEPLRQATNEATEKEIKNRINNALNNDTGLNFSDLNLKNTEIKELLSNEKLPTKGINAPIYGNNNLNDEVVEFLHKNNKKMIIEKISPREQELLKDLNFKHDDNIRASLDYQAIQHILKKHSKDTNPITYQDIANYRNFINNADEVIKTKDNRGNNTITAFKQINGYAVVVEVAYTGNNELALKTMYKSNGNYKNSNRYKEVSSALLTENNPGCTPWSFSLTVTLKTILPKRTNKTRKSPNPPTISRARKTTKASPRKRKSLTRL
ncbi:hypothetical protein HCD_08105 [Helicobacter cetorum MIT 99-5656]|uniref:Phage-Barnase-EndoU-ColicinE5/D-RelE like nuclease 3 domain-containing protein n=2 Tax=Helicobacter cetorum TaxID=138563 RepID=I0EUI6_HELCM|nr:hypothetical protein HCD_08105 [Helicobacter cetorum MIT 99-5656]